MQVSEKLPLLAIDVGNSRIKLGIFSTPGDCASRASAGALPIAGPTLPTPAAEVAMEAEQLGDGLLADWLAGEGINRFYVAIASVCPPATSRLVDALEQVEGMVGPAQELAASDIPISVTVDEPNKVGVDRIVAAAAANELRRADTPAIIIDIGTAITVDLVSTEGDFMGGAIMPGPTLAGRALAEKTALLPQVSPGELDSSPDALGTNTEDALQAGLYWGAVGAIRELIARQRDRLTTAPQVFLTGGASPAFARLIGGPDYSVRYLPSLTLSGVALAARSAISRNSESPT